MKTIRINLAVWPIYTGGGRFIIPLLFARGPDDEKAGGPKRVAITMPVLGYFAIIIKTKVKWGNQISVITDGHRAPRQRAALATSCDSVASAVSASHPPTRGGGRASPRADTLETITVAREINFRLSELNDPAPRYRHRSLAFSISASDNRRFIRAGTRWRLCLLAEGNVAHTVCLIPFSLLF